MADFVAELSLEAERTVVPSVKWPSTESFGDGAMQSSSAVQWRGCERPEGGLGTGDSATSSVILASICVIVKIGLRQYYPTSA